MRQIWLKIERNWSVILLACVLLHIGNRYSGQRERVMGHLVAFRVLNSFIFNVVGFKALAMKVGASFFFLSSSKIQQFC